MLILLLLTIPASADEHGDALKRARAEDKPLIIYFYSKYCIYCDAMDRDVLLDKEIKSSLNRDVVYFRVDVDTKGDIVRKYNIRGYPTTWLLEPTGKRIVALPGYIQKNHFKKVLAFLKGKYYKSMSLWDFVGQK